MRITYDAEADAMYIYLQGKAGQAVNHTRELGDGIAVDYTSADGIYGIEVLANGWGLREAARRYRWSSSSTRAPVRRLVSDLDAFAVGAPALDLSEISRVRFAGRDVDEAELRERCRRAYATPLP